MTPCSGSERTLSSRPEHRAAERPAASAFFTNRVRKNIIRTAALSSLLSSSLLYTQTTINLTATPLHTNLHPFGINLSGQTFYDSGQMLRNLIARNPGFEGEQWQSILHCKTVTPTTCTTDDQYTQWPANFMANAHYEDLRTNATGTVTTTTAAQPPNGITITFAQPTQLQPGDFLIVQKSIPGNAQAGWWTDAQHNATLSTEFHDLSPHTQGHQALRIEAAQPQQSGTINSYFDSMEGHSFVQLHGLYHLTFRAKPLTPGATLHISLRRLQPATETFLDRALTLKPGWNDYDLAIHTNEPPNSIGTIALTFNLTQASALLDDTSLTAPHAANNPTAFRDEVVQALRELHPATLRYMDNGTSFGSSIANLLGPDFARQRAGASTHTTTSDDIAIGIPGFLALCKAIGADPWITLPPGLSPEEARRLITFLIPIANNFKTIHLEPGNEQWNVGSFAGATINDPAAYGHRAAQIFSAMRSTEGFHAGHYDLILGTWHANTWWTEQELLAASNTPSGKPDTIAIAPYLFAEFNTAPNEESVFGPMFAQPEALDSRTTGLVQQQAAIAAKYHISLAVYETNLGTMSGAATQSAIDVTVPSLGAALAVASHMLLMQRDDNVTTQNLFALPEYQNPFASTTGAKETMPLWGAVIDMGGPTNRRRPTYYALQLLNEAILPTELTVTIPNNPTRNQPLSPNDHIELANAHDLQAFAFTDGTRHSLILLNLSRDHATTIQLTGPAAPPPSAQIHETQLTSTHITDNNEHQDLVHPKPHPYTNPQSLPPYSLTTLTW